MTTNIWGSAVEGGIVGAVQDALSGRVPMFGGVLVEQVTSVNGRPFRARDGWTLEAVRPLCEDGYVHFRRAGWMGRAFGVAMFSHIGAEQPDADEISKVHEADLKREQAANDQEVDVALDWLVSDEEEITEVYDVCAQCRCSLSCTHGCVYKYADGSLSCERCALAALGDVAV